MPDGILKNGLMFTVGDFYDVNIWHWLDVQEVTLFCSIRPFLPPFFPA